MKKRTFLLALVLTALVFVGYAVSTTSAEAVEVGAFQ